MIGVIAGLWGLFGGFCVEGLDLWGVVQQHGCWPWQVAGKEPPATPPSFLQYVVAEVIRLVVGGGLAWALAATGQVSGPIGAIAAGAAAPVIVGQLSRGIPLKYRQGDEVDAARQPQPLADGD